MFVLYGRGAGRGCNVPPRGVLDSYMNILVISMAGIGDTILATPFIHELRLNYPDARIDALVLWAGSKDILEGNPHLNTVHQRNLFHLTKFQSLRYIWSLRPCGYDISINTHPESRAHYRLIARIVGASTRLSHTYESFGLLDRFLVNRTRPQDYSRHSVENNLDLLHLLGKQPVLPRHELELFLSAADHDWAEAFLSSHHLQDRKRLGIHVGSGGTKNLALKRWPLGHYSQLIRKVKSAMPDLGVLLFGGPDEEPELQRVIQECDWPTVKRVRSGTLRQAAALMARCSAFVSVDTALMHVAAAVRVPRQIVIEAPTLNKTNEPYQQPFTLVRNPAVGGRNLDYYRYDGRGIKGTAEELTRLMAAVPVDAVYTAVRDALAG